MFGSSVQFLLSVWHICMFAAAAAADRAIRDLFEGAELLITADSALPFRTADAYREMSSA